MGKHSIIVIKNNKNEYLQYFDQKWNSYLFLNCKMKDRADTEAIIQKITRDLSLEENEINCQFVGEKTHRKFSESAKIEKEYVHYFYNVKINKELKEKEFNLNNIEYKWFTYDELIKDKRIQEVNSDIVKFIKEFDM